MTLALGSIAICASSSVRAHQNDWPKLVAKNPVIECRQALEVAKTVFGTAEPDMGKMVETIDLPADLMSISTQDGEYFEEYSYPNTPKLSDGNLLSPIRFSKFVHHGRRLVEVWYPTSWKDYASAMYVIDDLVDVNAFAANAAHPRFTSPVQLKLIPFIINSSGARILRSRDTTSLIVIDVGGEFDVLPDWNVYVSTPTGFEQKCAIQFHPRRRNLSTLLPSQVQGLLRLLDRTIGNEDYTGSLRPIDAIRTSVRKSVANAALRPWVQIEPYNSRDVVNAQLENWSHQSASCRRIYNAIKSSYPEAEKALVKYYQATMKLSHGEAIALAPKVLDIVFRTHYIFSKQ